MKYAMCMLQLVQADGKITTQNAKAIGLLGCHATMDQASEWIPPVSSPPPMNYIAELFHEAPELEKALYQSLADGDVFKRRMRVRR